MNSPGDGEDPSAPDEASPGTTGVRDDWYVLCRSRDLRAGKRPLSRTLFGTPVALFRAGDGTPGALLDRCPHRNVPLSLGRIVGPHLACRYHGWQFDAAGACRLVPGLCGDAPHAGRGVDAFPVREQDGFVWVYATPGAIPEREPFAFPDADEPGVTTVVHAVEAQGSLHACAENALDVPHTAFLHRGLHRGRGAPTEIEVVVRRWHDRVEAEFIGEPRPRGLAGRILAPGEDAVVRHWDRFFLPCIAQTEYRLGETSRFRVTTALTPVDDDRTRFFAVFTFRVPLPGRLVALLLTPVAKRIIAQDLEILARQTERMRRFGGAQFASTELDALGPHILRLLRAAERGERAPLEDPFTRVFRMTVS